MIISKIVAATEWPAFIELYESHPFDIHISYESDILSCNAKSANRKMKYLNCSEIEIYFYLTPAHFWIPNCGSVFVWIYDTFSLIHVVVTFKIFGFEIFISVIDIIIGGVIIRSAKSDP